MIPLNENDTDIEDGMTGGHTNLGYGSRFHGRSVRPVREADEKSEQSLVLAAISPRENVRVKSSPSGLNVSEEKVAKLILRNSSITEAEIANQLAITFRQVARIIAALKQKAGLKRRGTDKVGEWYFQ